MSYEASSSLLSIRDSTNGTNIATESPYNYVPTQYVTILFTALFGVSTFLHAVQALYFRMWWLFPTAVLSGIIEILGWSGRLWSSISPLLMAPYEMQITCTIIAPTPLIAANFIILGNVIKRLGMQYSRLPPKLYSIVFCSCDFISLIVQGVGGGLAASAVGEADGDPDDGGNIMLGGIIFQMITITVYVFCAAEFLFRYLKDRPIRRERPSSQDSALDLKALSNGRGVMDRKIKIVVAALVFSTLCLFIRSVYRTIELSDGWSGRIISTELYFNVLDGAMITLATYTLNFAHPGFLLPEDKPRRVDEKTFSSDSSMNTV